MKYVQVNNLDFNNIKTALKEYLRAKTDFTDFDFEGSVWSNLLDVLAYNTYYTAFKYQYGSKRVISRICYVKR